MYAFRVNGVVVLSSAAAMFVYARGELTRIDGKPLADMLATRKPSAAKRKSVKRREPVATCPKCDRVFFVMQGVKRHINFCKGNKKKEGRR